MSSFWAFACEHPVAAFFIVWVTTYAASESIKYIAQACRGSGKGSSK